MTEEIIIDSVDVAGCVRLQDDKISCDLGGECKGWENCYYKQLKRLEQERDELKNTIENQKLEYEELQCDLLVVEDVCECLKSENAELKQENKELKEKIIELSEEKGHLIVENNTLKESNQSLSMLGTDLVSANETVRKEFFRADKNKDMWREKAEKYRSTLEEINATVKTMINGVTPADNVTAYLVALNAIETRINEVLGNEQNN